MLLGERLTVYFEDVNNIQLIVSQELNGVSQAIKLLPRRWCSDIGVLLLESPTMVICPLQLCRHFPFIVAHIKDVEFAYAFADFSLHNKPKENSIRNDCSRSHGI